MLLKSERKPGEEKQNFCPDLESIKKYKKNIDRVTSCHYTGFAKGDKLSLGCVPLKVNSSPPDYALFKANSLSLDYVSLKANSLSLDYASLKANSLAKMRKDKSLQNVSREEGCRRRDF